MNIYMQCQFGDNSLVGIIQLLKANDVSKINLTPYKNYIEIVAINSSHTMIATIKFPTIGVGIKSPSPTFGCYIDTMYSKIAKIKDKWTMDFDTTANLIRCTTNSWGGCLVTDEAMIESDNNEIPDVDEECKIGLVCNSTMLCEVLKLPIIGVSKELIYNIDINPSRIELKTHHEYNKTSTNSFSLPLTAENTISLPTNNILQRLKAVQIEKILGFSSLFDVCTIAKINDNMIIRFNQSRNNIAVANIILAGSVDE